MPEDLKTMTTSEQAISSNNQNTNGSVDTTSLTEVAEERVIKLLEERLSVNTNRQKIGDVIVRKVIETRIIEVPVRREKLIVEQVSPEKKQLAEIDLSAAEISDIISDIELTKSETLESVSLNGGLTVSGSFSSPKIASLLLNAIAQEKNHGCGQVQVSIVVENEQQRQKYQEWFDRCSQKKQG